MANLYTLGYNHSSADRALRELITVKIPIIDIPVEPKQSKLAWQQSMLLQESGILYYWLQNLGNVLYSHHHGFLRIHDLEQHGCGYVLCACASLVSCHRFIVA